MGKASHALCGALLGGGGVALFFYFMSYQLVLTIDDGALGVYLFLAWGFSLIGVMLGALGGLAVERRSRERREPGESPK